MHWYVQLWESAVREAAGSRGGGRLKGGCGKGSAGQLSISRLICSGYVQVSVYTHHIHTQRGLLSVQASACQSAVSTVCFQGRQGIANKKHFTGPSGPIQLSASVFSFKHTHRQCLYFPMTQNSVCNCFLSVCIPALTTYG